MTSSKFADVIEASVKKSFEKVFKPLNKRLARLEAKIGSDIGLIGSAQIRLANRVSLIGFRFSCDAKNR